MFVFFDIFKNLIPQSEVNDSFQVSDEQYAYNRSVGERYILNSQVTTQGTDGTCQKVKVRALCPRCASRHKCDGVPRSSSCLSVMSYNNCYRCKFYDASSDMPPYHSRDGYCYAQYGDFGCIYCRN